MRERETTKFGKAVKHRLVDLDTDQEWLSERIRLETGLYMTSSYLSAILYGERKAVPIKRAICSILNLSEELIYEEDF